MGHHFDSEADLENFICNTPNWLDKDVDIGFPFAQSHIVRQLNLGPAGRLDLLFVYQNIEKFERCACIVELKINTPVHEDVFQLCRYVDYFKRAASGTNSKLSDVKGVLITEAPPQPEVPEFNSLFACMNNIHWLQMLIFGRGVSDLCSYMTPGIDSGVSKRIDDAKAGWFCNSMDIQFDAETIH